MVSLNVSDNGEYLTIVIPEQDKTHRFHAIWLRDNALDSATRSPGNGQRLIALRDIPAETSIQQASLQGNTIEVTFVPENKTVSYDLDWLAKNSYDQPDDRAPGWTDASVTPWDGKLSSDIPQADFTSVQSNPSDLCEWLKKLAQYGFVKLTGGPIHDEALMKVVELFGYVRETNYGRHFEVRTEVNPTNLAFTGLGLQAHTDNPYRDPVPTLQVLYCLESSAAGGENMVVDGFRAAMKLRAENPAWFHVLSQYCARFEYAGDSQTCLRSRRPMIEIAPDGELIGIRFNNRSTGAITDVPFEQMSLYYEAYRRLGEIIDAPEMEVSFRLEPGECFIVDNTRVLHARKAYSGTGTRWFQGCYADKDSLNSKITTLSSLQNEAAE